MVKHFIFKCKSCFHRTTGIIPFNLYPEYPNDQDVCFNEIEEEFKRNYECPKCGKSEAKMMKNKN